MMLSRPGVSIRRFISQRRVQDEYDDGVTIGTDRLGNKAGRKDAGTPKRRPYSKKRPPPPIIVSREQSVHDILDPLPPLPPYDTPRSSASSLSSADRHNDYTLSQSFDSKRSKSPLCSISSKEDRSRESLQLSSYGGDDFPPKPPPKGHARSAESMKRQVDLPGSNFDLIEALSFQSANKAPISKQRLRQSESLSSISDNIQQLIQEADEAFKAIDNPLTEVRISENNTQKELPRIPTPDQSPILKPATPVLQSRIQNPPLQVLTSPTQPPRRNTTATTGVQRKKSKKSRTRSMRPSRKPAAAKSAAKSGPGWALSDNMTELFSGKFFRRVEVDEMLTPSQLEAYRLRRMSIMQSEKSTETLDTESSDTPIEPFHLDDLPSRIKSASVELDVETPTAEKPNPPEFEAIVRRDFALEGRNEEQSANRSATSRMDIGEEPLEYKDAIFPTPPLRHSARFTRRSQGTLPSIPETSAVTTPKDDLYSSQNLGNSRDLVADSNYVFLQSSPCSMTSPIFRHGPIRLSKCDLMADMKVGVDDGLDWTAFQMAISGGAGDWFSESDDTIRRREAEEVEELVDWFDSWNFNRPGGLVKDFEIPSPTSTTSGEDYSDVSYGEIERDNPYSPHHRWQQSQRRMASESRQLDRDMSGLELDTSKMIPDDQSSYKSKDFDGRESYASLPQSPMLDLRVIRGPEGDDMDVVPMGYNLGHDLGDFLKWEAEHAYAGDFYSS
ncbi:hypothetical protein F4781DRAFT_342841 [Annulohypoxylon bovei var. microspora]|nr:hypothetical protein F4781DRAFT_342841 [Annulohypoxylon bovei var. microspora]